MSPGLVVPALRPGVSRFLAAIAGTSPVINNDYAAHWSTHFYFLTTSIHTVFFCAAQLLADGWPNPASPIQLAQ
jgi:hypothetical protein